MTCIDSACTRKENKRSTAGWVGKMGAVQGSCMGRDLTQQAGQPSHDRSTADTIVHWHPDTARPISVHSSHGQSRPALW